MYIRICVYEYKYVHNKLYLRTYPVTLQNVHICTVCMCMYIRYVQLYMHVHMYKCTCMRIYSICVYTCDSNYTYFLRYTHVLCDVRISEFLVCPSTDPLARTDVPIIPYTTPTPTSTPTSSGPFTRYSEF